MSLKNIDNIPTQTVTVERAVERESPLPLRGRWLWLVGGLVVGALVLYPLGNSADKFGINLLTQILIAAIFAMSYDLLFGYTGLLSFGPAAYYGLGAFGAGLLIARLNISNFLLGLVVAIVVSTVGALLLGFFSIRTSGVYFMMLTLALAQMLHAIAFKWDVTGSSDGIPVQRPDLSILGFSMRELIPFYLFVLACFLGCFFLLRMFLRAPFGQVLKGIRDNENRLTAIGYQTRNFKLLAFVISGGVSGLAGALNVYFNGFVGAQTLDWGLSGAVLVMVLLGGKGTLIGPVLGAFFIIWIQSQVQSSTIPLGNYTLADRWLSVLGIIFMVFVLVAPNGLVGIGKELTRRVREWQPKR